MSFPFELPMIADGAGTCGDLSGDDPDVVCCENTILRNPQKLTESKTRFLAGGGTALLAPTGHITHTRLEDLGYDDEFSAFLTDLTRLTAECSDGRPVGGVLCPSDPIASEYGQNVMESAYFDHLEKITLLKDAGTSFILLKDFSKLWDMRAGVLAAATAELPVFVLLNVDEEGKTETDTDYIAALITLQSLGASAFGIHCTAGTDDTALLIKKAHPHAEIPLIAAAAFSETELSQLHHLAENGASVFLDLSAQPDRSKLQFLKAQRIRFDAAEEKDSYAAANFREAFFLPDFPEFSEPIPCGYDMSDELIDLDDSSADAVYFHLNSTDDASFLAENAAMSYLPFAIHTNDPTTLEAALRYYQGRLIVDSHCDIDEDELHELAAKYGAILY